MAKAEDAGAKGRMFALRAAQWVGCSGAHKHNGEWMPCETHEELLRLSGRAEPKKKTAFEELKENRKKRKKRGRRDGWEKLGERKPLGFATMEGGGIVSAPIVAFPDVTIGKSYIPGVSPRDGDPDVFDNIESARLRGRMLGCIGVRRMPSATGRTIWMPCTTNSDYARLAGTTALGRRRQQEDRNRAVRTIVRQEIERSSRRRSKSLFEEIHGTKGIGRMRPIGNSISPNSMARRTRRAMSRISGEIDPKIRMDRDGDGFIFDGTWREMPDPTRATQALRSGRPKLNDDAWASPVLNEWLTPKKIKKGGKLKASELLNFDRLRLRRNRDEQARVLGVDVSVIDAMNEPDASLDPFDADKIANRALNMHPALIWGDAWLEPDENMGTPPKEALVGRMRPLTERDKRVLEMRASGSTLEQIGQELNVSKQRAQQILRRAIAINEIDQDSLSSRRSSGMIERDDSGRPKSQGERRKKVIESSVEKLKKIGLSDEEINLLMTGDRKTPVDTSTRDLDISSSLRSMSRRETPGMRSSRTTSTSPSQWPQSAKNTIIDWANSRPSFNVPYAISQKFKRDGELSDRDWRTLKRFYEQYGSGGALRLTSQRQNLAQFENVGANRMVQIILDRVKQDKRNRPNTEKTHYHIIGPGAMGKTTLREHLVKNGDIPADDAAAHVDADFIKMGIEGYNGGGGSEAVHRTSARASTDAVNKASDMGMDVVSEGTGYRTYEYKTTRDNSYRKVFHIPFTPYDVAEKRLKERNRQGGRQLRESQIREKGSQLYSFVTDQLRSGNMQTMYIWDMDVPEGAAPRVVAKIEDGVFTAFDEPKFKQWSEQHGGRRGGDSNLSWFKRNFPQK
jgi:predicted ABC-type ATPase/DNA-binding CsgD family transcriptional regulator